MLLTPKITYAATNLDLGTSGNWNVRIDGASASDGLSLGGVYSADLNGNGKNDLIVVAPATDYNSRTDSGSIYIIYDSHFSSLTGTNNTIDLGTSTNWDIRIDGVDVSDMNGTSGGTARARAADIDNDGKPDLIINAGLADNNSRADSGSVYILYNTLLSTYSGTGNTINLSTSTNYNVRIDGPVAGYVLGRNALGQPVDVNGDGRNDLILGAPIAGYNSRATSGSVYILYNALINLSGTGNNLDLATTSNFNIRFDGAVANQAIGGSFSFFKDINNDGNGDLIFQTNQNNNGSIGGAFIIFNNIFSSLSGTGNLVDLATSTNWNIRIDGVAGGTPRTGQVGQLNVADIDSDNKNDIIIDEIITSTQGSAWILLNTILSSYSGTGNTIALGTSTNYNLKITGAASGDQLGFQGFTLNDFFATGKNDLVIAGNLTDFNSRTDSGSIYVISNAILNSNLSGTGNSMSVSSTSNYSLRYDAATAGDRSGVNVDTLFDVDGDGKKDLLFASYFKDSNSRTDSGSLYLIYNFPHTVSVTQPTTPSSSSTVTVTGSVSATNSTTTISGVQYQVDSNSLTGTWTECTASDGSFNSTSESYSCSVSSLSDAAHTIYFRSYDTNTSYTAQSSFASTSVTVDTSTPTLTSISSTAESTTGEVITWTSSEAASSIVDYGLTSSYGFTTAETDTVTRVTSHSFHISGLSPCTGYHFRVHSKDAAGNEGISGDNTLSTSGCSGSSSSSSSSSSPDSGASVTSGATLTTTSSSQIITALLEANTLPFSATLHSYLHWVRTPICIYYKGVRLCQVTPPQKVYLTSLFNGANILPFLLHKPINISFTYSPFDLIAYADSRGRPTVYYNPASFKLAYSADGIHGWNVLPSSVVDSKNRTVAVIHKVGGYYVIVGRTYRKI